MISNFVGDFDGRVVGVEFDIELVDVEWNASIFNLCNGVTIFILRLLLVQELFAVLILVGLVLLRQIQICQVTEDSNKENERFYLQLVSLQGLSCVSQCEHYLQRLLIHAHA